MVNIKKITKRDIDNIKKEYKSAIHKIKEIQKDAESKLKKISLNKYKIVQKAKIDALRKIEKSIKNNKDIITALDVYKETMKEFLKNIGLYQNVKDESVKKEAKVDVKSGEKYHLIMIVLSVAIITLGIILLETQSLPILAVEVIIVFIFKEVFKVYSAYKKNKDMRDLAIVFSLFPPLKLALSGIMNSVFPSIVGGIVWGIIVYLIEKSTVDIYWKRIKEKGKIESMYPIVNTIVAGAIKSFAFVIGMIISGS